MYSFVGDKYCCFIYYHFNELPEIISDKEDVVLCFCISNFL
jgi:hypothetical protein